MQICFLKLCILFWCSLAESALSDCSLDWDPWFRIPFFRMRVDRGRERREAQPAATLSAPPPYLYNFQLPAIQPQLLAVVSMIFKNNWKCQF